jgi:cell division protein ZipA
MPELRLALILLGIAVIIAVYLYSRWQLSHDRERRPPGRRGSAPADGKLPSLRIPGLRRDRRSAGTGAPWEAAPDRVVAPPRAGAPQQSGEPGPRVALEGGPQKIVVLHLIPEGGQGFEGSALADCLRDGGLEFGQYEIFHRVAHGSDGRPGIVFSVAHMVEPGRLDPTRMAGEQFSGLTFFAVLPGPMSGQATLTDMLNTARSMAGRLGGDVRDEARGPLTRQTETHLREQISEFERRLRSGGQAR